MLSGCLPRSGAPVNHYALEPCAVSRLGIEPGILAIRRSIDRGNLVASELAARELGSLDLPDALELTALVAVKNRARSRRMCARWLERWMSETAPAIDEAVMVAGCLAALGSTRHHEALETLRATTRPARP